MIILIYILLVCHIYFTLKLRFIQRFTLKGIRHSFFPSSEQRGIGTYKAFASALGTTVGAGNITGVAVAISTGGAGAVFWMWLSGILAMGTKYAEGYLSLAYSRNGTGGTAVLLSHLGKRRLSVIWSILCAVAGLFMGSAVPSNSLAETSPLPPFVTGTILSVVFILVISFGLSGIADVAGLLVPVMSVIFIAFCLAVIAVNIASLPRTLYLIVSEAFSVKALLSGTLGACIKSGITRGLYSNESGLGSGGVLAAESGDTDFSLGALSSMTTVFWDTVVMCALTGITFLIVGDTEGKNTAEIMNGAFYSLPCGKIILPLCMSLFVFACVIGWYYIAKRVLSGIFKSTVLYDILFSVFLFIGAITDGGILWLISDKINLLMLIPSLYVLIKMSDKILYINNK